MHYCGHCGAPVTLTAAGPCPSCGTLISPVGELLAPPRPPDPWAQGVGSATIPDRVDNAFASQGDEAARRQLRVKRALTVWGTLCLVLAGVLVCADGLLVLSAR